MTPSQSQSLGAAEFLSSINTPSQRMAFGAAAPAESDNPLVAHPWRTLGLWIAAVWVGFRVAEGVGKRIAGVK